MDHCLLEASLLPRIGTISVDQQVDDESVARCCRQMDGLCSHVAVPMLSEFKPKHGVMVNRATKEF